MSALTLLRQDEKPEGKLVSAVSAVGEALIPLGELVDIQMEIKRLIAEAENMRNEITRSENKLQNPGFMNKAPKELLMSETEKLERNRMMLSALQRRINDLNL